ncbi:hypothetical protein [Paraburkholderia sp. C35]|uniref:hypothetical protein n=1 Tax=Paraburkholderia sp. C35 TaxID=2126993 RepID=UPI000D696534|nr:hypothetical protein [Paraburkholderia sp. C35]
MKPDPTYEQHLETVRAAIMRRIVQAREHPPGSKQHGAYLGTAETILTGFLRHWDVSDTDETRLRRLIDNERAA